MDESKELKELKSTLRSLVVSSPTQMDLRSLLRDYRNMMGQALPISKFKYRDPLQFLKERCSDCFLFQGQPSNPQLILIVTDNIRHIDEFVRKQKIPSGHKIKGKRRSVPESTVKVPNLIVETFVPKPKPASSIYSKPHSEIAQPPGNKPSEVRCTSKCSVPVNNNKVYEYEPKRGIHKISQENGTNSSAYHNFIKRRIPKFDSLDEDKSSKEDDSEKHTSDCGAHSSSLSHPSSTSSSCKQAQLEELKTEVKEVIADSPEGVWCADLMKLYRKRYGRELDFTRFGFTTIVGLVAQLDADVSMVRAGDAGGLLLRPRRLAEAAPAPRPRRLRTAPPQPPQSLDPDDALPGIDFDPDVFPADCMQYSDSIPLASLDGLEPGAMVEVMVGEVYSPSHFWLLRLGDDYHIAMEELMDEMTEYYSAGEGRDRALAVGAVREGHYCSSLYERDWHRSIIVKVVDSDTVKVRHVDYGTVEAVAAAALKPLRREWARLPAQALRARLAGVRPGACGRRWPHAAALHFLGLVQDRPLVANVVAVDHQERVLEVCLVDTSTERDVRLDRELVRAGHADPRPDSALAVSHVEAPLHAANSSSGDSGSGDANSDEVDSLLAMILHFDDGRSEVSASASEVAAPAPRIAPWGSDVRADACAAARASWRLARLRALHGHGPLPPAPRAPDDAAAARSQLLRKRLAVSKAA